MAFLQSAILNDSGLVDHAFSARTGGCSSGPLASLNTAFHNGDSEKNVLENRQRFFQLFGYDSLKIVSACQVHGSELMVVDRSRSGEGTRPGSAKLECDALVTTESGLPLTAYAADCMLIYIASLQQPLVALAHAGWRGTLEGIGPKVVRYLDERFGAKPADLLVALSPAVCKSCYRVDGVVAAKFQDKGWADSASLEAFSRESWGLDLAGINYHQLLNAGIAEHNLARSCWCTSCRPDLFYSYRRDKGFTGRMIGFIAIKNQPGGSGD